MLSHPGIRSAPQNFKSAIDRHMGYFGYTNTDARSVCTR